MTYGRRMINIKALKEHGTTENDNKKGNMLRREPVFREMFSPLNRHNLL